MEIVVYGPGNPDGSSHPAWYFEIEAGCERVLVTPPGFYKDQRAPKLWGFKGGKQVYGTLVRHDQEEFWA